MASVDNDKMNFILQHEHSYSKASYEQDLGANGDHTHYRVRLRPPSALSFSLTPDIDTLEAILISLLRSHSQAIEGGALLPSNEYDISPKSLSALSNEQLNFLVTSSSVNYMAIQQILTQKSKQMTPLSIQDSASISSSSDISSTELPKQQTPPLTTPTSTLTITSQQLLELQSQLTSLLQQQTAALGGQHGPLDQQSLNNLLKQQLMNYVTGITNNDSNNELLCNTAVGSSMDTSISDSNVSSTVQEQVDTSGVSQQSHGKKKKDPDAKRVPTPFNIYFSDVYHSILKDHPNLPFSDVSKIVSSMWNNLGQEGKKKYYDKQEEIKRQNLLKSIETPPTDAHSPNDPPSTVTTPLVKSETSNKKQRRTSKGEGRKKTEGMCIANDCYNMSVYNKERGPYYCSNECVVNYCRAAYSSWIMDKKIKA